MNKSARVLTGLLPVDHSRGKDVAGPSRAPRQRGALVTPTLRTAIVLVLALAWLPACARTSVEHASRPGSALPRPALVIVHDFAVSPADVSLDRAVGARFHRMISDTPAAQRELELGRQVARIVTASLVEEVGKLGIPAAVAAAEARPVTGPTLSIEGHFLTVEEGNRMRRMVVGFGAGASEVRTLVQVYEHTTDGRRLVEDFYTTVKSSLKPGMGPMVGVGAAAGRAATSAVVSGGLGLATAHGQTVQADAHHTAKAIAKELEKFFAEQGWIPRR